MRDTIKIGLGRGYPPTLKTIKRLAKRTGLTQSVTLEKAALIGCAILNREWTSISYHKRDKAMLDVIVARYTDDQG